MSGTERRLGWPGKKVQQGFVLLVVLMVLVAMSTAVILSYDAAAFESVSSRREMEQVLAKNLAEGCLDRVMKHAQSTVAGAVTPDTDLDRLLDPNLGATLGSGSVDDEFVPTPNDGVVYVPNTGSDPMRRFALLRDVGGTFPELQGGGCLVRFDDNMDDNLPGLGPSTGNNTAAEGGGTQVMWRDRDGVVSMTAIGLYPVLGATADADAYAAAHARVTLIGRLNVQVSLAAQNATLMVGDDLDLANGASHNGVCGAGGATYDNYYGVASGNFRFGVCGEYDDDAAAPVEAPDPGDAHNHMCPTSVTGGAPCEPQFLTPSPNLSPDFHSGNVAGPAIRTGTGGTWPFVRGLQKATGADYRNDDPFSGSMGTHPGDGDACVFYYASPGYGGVTEAQVFVWDHTAADATASMSTIPTVNAIIGSNATENCQTTTAQRSPCAWAWTGTAWNITCGASQSPCWKLVTVMDGTAEMFLQDRVTSAGPKESSLGSAATDEVFQPVADRDIPFVTGAGTWDLMCRLGGPAGNQTINPGDRGLIHNGASWAMKNDILADNWPGNKAIHMIDNPSSAAAMLQLDKKLGDSGGDVRHSFVVRSSVQLTEEVYNCCPQCDCSAFPPNWSNPAAGAELQDTGYFIFAGRHVFFDSDDKVKQLRGDVLGATVHINKKANIQGDLYGWDNCAVVSTVSTGCDELKAGTFLALEQCDSPGAGDGLFETFTDGASICIRDENVIIGGLWSNQDVSIHKKNIITNRESYPGSVAAPDVPDVGAVNSGRDLWMKEDNVIIGRTLVLDDMAIKKHNAMYWPNATPSTPSIIGIELRTSPETW